MINNHDPATGFVGAFISLGLMIFSKISAGVITAISAALPIATKPDFHFPPWIMEGSQIIAWWCVGGTFIIATLNYFEIKLKPFKRKK